MYKLMIFFGDNSCMTRYLKDLIKTHNLIPTFFPIDRFHHQALVEVKILDALRRRDKDNQFNIIHMGEYFYFRNHLCITFELMG